MNPKSSLRKFKPAIDQFESRELMSAGLAPLTGHASALPAGHELAAKQKNVAIVIRNDTTGKDNQTITYTVTIKPTSPPFSETLNVARGDGGRIPYFRTYTGTDEPKFYITYYKISNDPASVVSDQVLLANKFDSYGDPSRPEIFAKGKTWKFISDGTKQNPDKIKLVG